MKRKKMLIAVQVCAELEWKCAKSIRKIKRDRLMSQPFGKYFNDHLAGHKAIVFQSGATKTRAAAACQFAIDRWDPGILINLGTCGGVADDIKNRDMILAGKTIQYDVIQKFGKPSKRFLKDLETALDLSWADLTGYPANVRRGIIASADQDLDWAQRQMLKNKGVLAADWESASIAAVCRRNGTQCMILRGVSDMPADSDQRSGEHQEEDYKKNTCSIMEELFRALTKLKIR